ncbi:MAG: hypothetical protein AAB197_04795 [Deltaproteobacteria bacterium]
MAKLTFHSIIAPTHDHLSAIGRVAVLWTFLEKNIESLVWELAPLKQLRAQAVTTHLSNTILIDISKSLAHEVLREKELEMRLQKQLDHINNTLRPKRNKVVHGIWGPTATADKIALIETTARGIVKFKVGEEMTVEDILKIAAEIDQAIFDLSTLTFEISRYLGQITTIHV